MKAIILGATKGMGRALARAMAARGDELFLLGRSEEELEKSASDLAVRGGRKSFGHGFCDLEKRDSFDGALDAAWTALGNVDAFVITAAIFDTQDHLEDDPDAVANLLDVNLSSTVALCERVRVRMLESGGGTICAFSSVAGDRGRKPVVIYGASKAGLSYYLEGLDLRYRDQGLKVVTIKPGFIRTSMTDGLDEPPFAADADEVVADVLDAIDKGKPVVYVPRIWKYVMAVVKRIPRSVMRKLSF